MYLVGYTIGERIYTTQPPYNTAEEAQVKAREFAEKNKEVKFTVFVDTIWSYTVPKEEKKYARVFD